MKDRKNNFDGIWTIAIMMLCTGISFSWANQYEVSVVSCEENEELLLADEVYEEVNETAEGGYPETGGAAFKVREVCRDERPEDFEELLLLASEKEGLYLGEICLEDGKTSYAQLLLDELIARDTAWFGEIYTLSKNGVGESGSVDVKNVSVLYKDGDQNAQTAVSNAEEIIAMASVYAREQDITEIGDVRAYVNELWKLSHTYETEQGEMYFCTECFVENAVMAEVETESNTETAAWAAEENVFTDSNAAPEITECPGHIDLAITAVIHTLNGNETLYDMDRIGNRSAENGEWSGWTEKNREKVEELCSLSWYQDYAVHSTVKQVKHPLTEVEIETFMELLSGEGNEYRKKVIRYALESVGRVPYYWGGKPSGKGYGDGRFAVTAEPDSEGRTTRGLDCSGWISWVYWSATEERLPYEGTDGLCSLGSPVDFSDLRPGDLAIRTGEDSHAVIYLGRTADGRMLCVHESSYAGTVSVTVMSTE